MHRILLPAVAALLVLAAGCTTGSVSAVPAGPPQPAVWAVRDADSTMYFYGTIHLRKAGAPWGGPVAERALGEAQEVWTEIEFDPAQEAALQQVVARYGIDTTRTLSSQMEPKRAAQLRAAAVQIGVPPEAFDVMKPWLASLTLAVVPMTKAGYDPNAGVDRAIDRIAEGSGKTMRWFETGEAQIQFMSGMSDPLQMSMLYEAIDEVGKGTAVLERMESAWEVGDERVLAEEMVTEMRDDYPELYEVLLKRRNAAWVEVLSREMAGAGVDFVAVGAAHLIGPDSVLAMMRARGFTVERVSPPAP